MVFPKPRPYVIYGKAYLQSSCFYVFLSFWIYVCFFIRPDLWETSTLLWVHSYIIWGYNLIFDFFLWYLGNCDPYTSFHYVFQMYLDFHSSIVSNGKQWALWALLKMGNYDHQPKLLDYLELQLTTIISIPKASGFHSAKNIDTDMYCFFSRQGFTPRE